MLVNNIKQEKGTRPIETRSLKNYKTITFWPVNLDTYTKLGKKKDFVAIIKIRSGSRNQRRTIKTV